MDDVWHWLKRMILALMAIQIANIVVQVCKLAGAPTGEWVGVGLLAVSAAVWLYCVARWALCFRRVRRALR